MFRVVDLFAFTAIVAMIFGTQHVPAAWRVHAWLSLLIVTLFIGVVVGRLR